MNAMKYPEMRYLAHQLYYCTHVERSIVHLTLNDCIEGIKTKNIGKESLENQ